MEQTETLLQKLQTVYSQITMDFKAFLQADPQVEREDTCKGLLHLLEQIKCILAPVDKMNVEDRAKNYHVVYNAVTYITEIASVIRKSNYAFESIQFLLDAIVAMESNLILQYYKYSDKRTQIYLHVCRIYEEEDYYQQALALLQIALGKYKQLKAIYELDQPVPSHVSLILDGNIKIIKVMQLKYSMQAGGLAPAEWKKKVEEEFLDDQQAKLLCLVECLRTETRKHSNIFVKNLKTYKESLLQLGYEWLKPSLETLHKGLLQQKDKIQCEVAFRSTPNLTQEQINEEIKKRREIEEKYVKEIELKKASEACPLQYHTELIHYAMQAKSSKILGELLEFARVRVQCRRIEVPYVNDISIIASESPNPNIPNGYTKIPIDLNSSNLQKELAKLRKSGKKGNEIETLPPANVPAANAAKEDKAKDAKKGGKQPVPPPPIEEKDKGPSEWELQQMQHKFVFLLLKKSMSPENALYDLKIVMGNEENGPVGYVDSRKIIVPYIQENMKPLASKVSQYTGVRQATGLLPYLILYHSRNSLSDDNEKQNILTDVQPVIGKNPIVPAKWGYHKIPIDLRQVPEEFIKSSSHEYIYLSYKTDELFFVCQRHIDIIRAFFELQSSYNQRKATSRDQDKLLEMDISYSLQKLDSCFDTLQNCLKGELGQQYYLQKNDFLTHFCFQIWSKYIKRPLVQFDYVMEQRLYGQIIDYDYEGYRKVIEQAKGIFLEGLKVLNLIILNNIKSDVLLLAKVNLQLVKLLEQGRQYKSAMDNARLCLDRLRIYRDKYLTKGVLGNHDLILPFCLTVSNKSIKQTLQLMKNKYRKQRQELEKINRIKERERKQLKALTTEQLQEEEKEYEKYRKLDQYDLTINKLGNKQSQVYSIVSAVQLDMTNLYFRVALKRSEEIKQKDRKQETINGIKSEELEGLASTLKQKLGLMDGPTHQTNQKNQRELQSTLIQANKLPPSKPRLQRSELKLIEQNQKNPYAFSLLMMNLAALNSQSQEKKYFLMEALKLIEKAKEEEAKHLEASVQNAIFIFSSIWDSQLKQEQSNDKVSPFKDIYTPLWQAESDIPRPPILIAKNSQSICLKLPPFFPKKQGDKGQKAVKFLSLYGKPSANGVDVSLNCVDLVGTGIKKVMGKTMKISSLRPNNLYCFAAAGIDQHMQTMGIGKTGEDIGTYNPLSIPMLSAYLSKISYQIGEYDLAEKSARVVLQEYCQTSQYLSQDERANYHYYYVLNEEALSNVSLVEMRTIGETFYILGLCERRRVISSRDDKDKLNVAKQDKQKLVTNLLVLAGMLVPAMSSPLMSLPLLVPDKDIVFKAFLITLIPDRWMNPNMRRIGASVMQKLMRWGLQHNEISLSRRLVYRWNERKFMVLGKMIQIEEKKQVKKGKDSKQQQAKLVDKYCRILVEKSPHIFDSFEDSMAVINEDYYDYVVMFVERAKEQIATLASMVDNPSEELDALSNHLNSKIELLEYLKDPVASIKKIGTNSPYYFEYNCKILKKAIESLPQNDLKGISTKAEDLEIPDVTQELKLSKEVYQLMLSALKEDIPWTPCAKEQLQYLQQKTGKDHSRAIRIYSDFESKYGQFLHKFGLQTSLQQKYKDFDYLSMWVAELYGLKALSHIVGSNNDFSVKKGIRVRYDKIKSMNLDDLLKKQKEVLVLDKEYYSFSDEQTKKLKKILTYLSQGVFAAYTVQNWLKLQNMVKLALNFICYTSMTPFNHAGTNVWVELAAIALCCADMLVRIRKNGFHEFKRRYERKMIHTQQVNINTKLLLPNKAIQPLIQPFVAVYYHPDLDSSTTKTYWFMSQPAIDIEAISSFIAYAVNTLRVQNKYNLLINVIRQFCNATQHYYSLQLLPFMINAQSNLQKEVDSMIANENNQLENAKQEYEKEKEGKKKRAAKITGEKFKYEIDFEQASTRLTESLRLLNEQKQMIDEQIRTSKRIIEELIRDTSKPVLMQKEQRKYMQEFGQDQEHMYRQYGEESRLARNRKNAIKDIIYRYDDIYDKLQSSKTSKDPLTEIQNRNDVGNLNFAAGSIEKAYEYWSDSLATIFKTVQPIEHYHDILQQYKPCMASKVGEKEIVLALSLLFKISCFCCYKRLEMQRLCARFACHLAYSLFESGQGHPQTYMGFKSYRAAHICVQNIFADQETINIGQLIASLQYFITHSIDDENSLSALPMIALLQHLAIDVVKNASLAIKVKVLKGIALIECGFIAEAIDYAWKVAYEKDMPLLWTESSDYLKREKGANWIQDSPRFNDCQPGHINQNKVAIVQLKKLTLRAEFIHLYGVLSPALFNYLKGAILAKVFEAEIIKDDALNQARLQQLSESQAMFRDCLKRLSLIQQHSTLLEDYQIAVLQFKQNEVSDQLKKAMQSCRNRMIEHLKKNGVEDNMIKAYELQESTSLKRNVRLQFMCKVRLTIERVNQSRNLLGNCYIIMKNGLRNINRYCNGARSVETGIDPELKPVIAAPVAAKKDDKKAGKKEEEPVMNSGVQVIDVEKEKELKKKVESSSSRTTINAYWQIKMTFQIGRILFRQNNFEDSIKVLEHTLQICSQYDEKYVSLLAKGYLCRCQTRLGSFSPESFVEVIKEMEERAITDVHFVCLVMDFGELLGAKEGLTQMSKGKDVAGRLWQNYGMTLIMAGIGHKIPTKTYISKDQLTAEQEQLIAKKKKVENKAGKDDKKQAKKEDPKKKKDDNKPEYKVTPLLKQADVSLLELEKYNFVQYSLGAHPNYHQVSLYHPECLLYIRCYLRLLEEQLRVDSDADYSSELEYMPKLLHVLESYNTTIDIYKIRMFALLGRIYKKTFIRMLFKLLADTKKNYLELVPMPFEDLPLNAKLVNIPAYSAFLDEHRGSLGQAKAWAKKCLTLFENSLLFFEKDFRVQQIVWEAADIEYLLAEYVGHEKPKYFPEEVAMPTNDYANCVYQGNGLVELAIRVQACKWELSSNYLELSSKSLDATAKIDEDIAADIMDLDRQSKRQYPALLADIYKNKSTVTTLDLITYMVKMHREAQCMTFGNPQAQCVLYKCHRLLFKYAPAYKQKCTLTSLQVPPKKSPKIVDNESISIKSISQQANDRFLYLLGAATEGEAPYYGRITISSKQLSKLTQELLALQSKMAVSDKRSEAVKERDYMLYRKEFQKILQAIGKRFSSTVTENELKVDLSSSNLKTLFKMLDTCGFAGKNKEINAMFRHLHRLKYQL